MIELASPPLPLDTGFEPVLAAAFVAVAGIVGHRRLTSAPRHPGPSPRTAAPPWRRHDHWQRAAMVVALGGTALVVGPLVTLIVISAAIAARRFRPIRTARRRRRRIEHDLPAAMDLLVLSVRAGLTPYQGFDQIGPTISGPVGEAFEEVKRRTERGQPFADALDAMSELLGTRAGGLADVIATSDRHGLPLGPTLDQLVVEVRAARQRLDQAEARKLPVRLAFPLVVCTLPSFVLLAIVPAVIAALSSLGGTSW